MKVVKIDKVLKPKTHNQMVAEENANRMKGISDILIGTTVDETSEQNTKVLKRFVSELREAQSSRDNGLITQKAEQLRDGLIFAGYDREEIKQSMLDDLEGWDVELADSPEDILEQARIKYDETLNEIEANRVWY